MKWLAAALLAAVAACAPDAGEPPDLVTGTFEDDYGIRYHITADLWHQLPGSRYHVVRWDSAGRSLVARNDSANPADGGRWTRIDWVRLEDMAPWQWAFCIAVWDAATMEEALAAPPADRAAPREGCGGFPFSRMRPRSSDP